MSDLILGTAEFNPAGYAGKPCPSEQEIVRILNLAWEGGIRRLDCADTYRTEGVEKYFGGFDRINKSRSLKPNTWYHYKPGEEAIPNLHLASVYDPEQVTDAQRCIVPLNINNTEFVDWSFFAPPIVRSVFDRGRLLEQGYTAKDCLSFVKRHYVDGVIVGVNSVQELKEILLAWT